MVPMENPRTGIVVERDRDHPRQTCAENGDCPSQRVCSATDCCSRHLHHGDARSVFAPTAREKAIAQRGADDTRLDAGLRTSQSTCNHIGANTCQGNVLAVHDAAADALRRLMRVALRRSTSGSRRSRMLPLTSRS